MRRDLPIEMRSVQPRVRSRRSSQPVRDSHARDLTKVSRLDRKRERPDRFRNDSPIDQTVKKPKIMRNKTLTPCVAGVLRLQCALASIASAATVLSGWHGLSGNRPVPRRSGQAWRWAHSWWLIAFSLIATTVGSYSFVKYSNKGFGYGLSSSQTARSSGLLTSSNASADYACWQRAVRQAYSHR